ncbi:ABC transporter permease [Rhodococcus sp. NPDC057014]|uniref:ABC transporter permease n=1 Tax=Rhodococcus sp. NPDC057014 TaxID=3346000 RepID=UPI00364484F2
MQVIAKKSARLVLVMFIVTTATYFLLQLLPGDPARTVVGAEGTAEQYEQVRRELGLDKPILERYVNWLGSLARGDLGNSLVPPTLNVSEMIQTRLPVTIELAVLAILIALVLAIPVALASAYRAGGSFDRIASTIAFALISLPSFVLAIFLVFLLVFYPQLVQPVVVGALLCVVGWLARRTTRVSREYPPGKYRTRYLVSGLGGAAGVALVALILSVAWPDFPRQGFARISEAGIVANLNSLFLPALALALTEAAVLMKVLYGDLTQTLKEDFVLSAKAKGMPAPRVLFRDALRPSSFSLITVAGVALGRLLGGTVIIETIFNLPGMGSMLVQAILGKDYPVVLGGVLVLALGYVALNAVVDISYTYLDPRLRRGRV